MTIHILIPALPFLHIPLYDKLPSQFLENPQSIGEHLKRRRQELKLRQKEVAEILDVSEDTITYWENDRSKPYIGYYPQIIQFLGYNPFHDTSTLGGRIKKYRIENGLSQEDLSRLVGTDETSILAWEANKRFPLPNKRQQLEAIISSKELS